MRRRLDTEMVRRKLSPSREAAQHAISLRRVLVGGVVAEKPARQVDASEPITIVGDAPRYVSRGGEKLAGALQRFSPAGDLVRGKFAFDAGASTGGFTDCLLQNGAAGVVAVDVGSGQLHERLRADPRVEVHERVNLRTADVAMLVGARRFPLVVADLSFISLRSVAPNLRTLSEPGGVLILLIKPQFEAGRNEVSKGKGIVREPETWRRVLHEIADSFGEIGLPVASLMPSPITGTDGNVEFLGLFESAQTQRLRNEADGLHSNDDGLREMIDDVVYEVIDREALGSETE